MTVQALDVRLESSEASLPTANSKYSNISCGIIGSVYHGSSIEKLFIGTRLPELRFTSSAMLIPNKLEVIVGPAVKLESAQIFVASQQMEDFLYPFNQAATEPLTSFSQLRQLTLSYVMLSPCELWRATMEELNEDLHMPATVFTIYDLPGDGYGLGPSRSRKNRVKDTLAVLEVSTGEWRLYYERRRCEDRFGAWKIF